MAEHPPYEITNYQQERTWRKWTYDATDAQLLAALRGSGDSWESVPARECSDELKQRGSILVGASPVEAELERKPTQADNLPRSGDCVECGRYSSQLSATGSCEGCVMQAAIDTMEH